MKIIQSRENPILKQAAKLSKKSAREEQGCFLLEGERLVRDAWERGAVFQRLFIEKTYTGFCPEGVETYQLEERLFRLLSQTQSPQGIIAVVQLPHAQVSRLPQDKPLVVCDRVADPGNLGTIIRTADAAGFGGIVLLPGSVDPFSPKVVRATMGSLFALPIIFLEELSLLKSWPLVCADLEASQDVYQTDLTAPFALVIGNEANGITPDILQEASVRVKIPMVGESESLNAAVSFGVIAYEALRQRLYR